MWNFLSPLSLCVFYFFLAVSTPITTARASSDDTVWIDRALVRGTNALMDIGKWSLSQITKVSNDVRGRIEAAEWNERLLVCAQHPKCVISEEKDDNPVFWEQSRYRWTKCRTPFDGWNYEDCRFIVSQTDNRVFQFRHACPSCDPDEAYCELIRNRVGMCMWPSLPDGDKSEPKPFQESEFDFSNAL